MGEGKSTMVNCDIISDEAVLRRHRPEACIDVLYVEREQKYSNDIRFSILFKQSTLLAIV